MKSLTSLLLFVFSASPALWAASLSLSARADRTAGQLRIIQQLKTSQQLRAIQQLRTTQQLRIIQQLRTIQQLSTSHQLRFSQQLKKNSPAAGNSLQLRFS